ncbi:MAG: SAM-dependent methyltransferase [Lachnospiraceae bacterium]|jgi:SAM-dependent methyltransferase|nr:SAM-dependent methyltransferase [Lachnospiraceae bacterium]
MNHREELDKLWDLFLDESLERILFSNTLWPEKMVKAKVRPLLLQNQLKFQLEEFSGNQAFHKNLDREAAASSFTALLENQFRQCEIQSEKGWAQVLVSKKGTITIKRKLRKKAGEDDLAKQWKETAKKGNRLMHNREKTYMLEEGKPVPFLIDLGVMTKEGKIIRSRYDKFRQINRFLEFIEDILPQLSKEKENTIIDFGCGKSYLTFAMYYYLKEQKNYPVRIIGLDLKQDVICRCNELSRQYGFEKLAFFQGDIASYKGVSQVDMVVTLHACDTATDHAIAKAISWGAKVILSVPCCQHEWNQQMKNELMKPILDYGLLKERMAALYTDGIRAEILEYMGYRTQILEFIEMEHTPKNLLIRAVKQGKRKDNRGQIQTIMDFWNVKPTLAALVLNQENL